MSLNRALQRELDDFYKKVSGSDYSIRRVTKSAFTQARAKLNPWAFQRLNEVATKSFYESDEYYTWHHMRLLAVDGTRLVLPNHSTTIDQFGVHNFGPNADQPRCMATASMLYDVLNLITIDAQIDSYSTSETELLNKHLESVKPNDLILFDRGYPSILLFFQLRKLSVHFCIRMKEDWWTRVRDFANSGEKERIVEFQLPAKDRKKIELQEQDGNYTIRCRLIKISLDNGGSEILCTSLLDKELYPYSDFQELYHYRWNEEEAYKLLKCRIELENFSGKTAHSVRQDFHAKVFLMTMCAVFSHPIDEKVRQEYQASELRKYSQKINRTGALAMTREILVPLFIKRRFTEALKAFDRIVYQTREIIRPGRSVPRNKRQKVPIALNYKPL